MGEIDLAGLDVNDLAGLEYGEFVGELDCETNPSISSCGSLLSDLGIFILYSRRGTPLPDHCLPICSGVYCYCCKTEKIG